MHKAAQYCGVVDSFGTGFLSDDDVDSEGEVSIHITTDAGEEVIWKAKSVQSEYYKYGDYLIKIAGEKTPAIFRKGKQIKGGPFYYNKDINFEEWRQKINKNGIGENGKPLKIPETAQQSGTPSSNSGGDNSANALGNLLSDNTGAANNPAEANNAAPPAAQDASKQGAAPVEKPAPSPTEDDVKRLVDDAAKLWQAGDKNGAIKKSEEALAARKILYGENHELVKKLQSQIDSAKASLTK